MTNKCSTKAFSMFVVMAFIVFLFETNAQDRNHTDARASVSSTINCIHSTVTLQGRSDTPNARFSWTGPGGYKATSRNAETALPGEYTLKVVGPAGITTDVVNVTIDTVPPREVKATVSGMLTCADTLVALTGSSSTPGVTYDWKGAKGYSSDEQKPQVKFPGIYLLKVTNPLNGCITQVSAEVKQNIVSPSGVKASVSGVLTCNTNSVTLSGYSTTKNVVYRWLGPASMSSSSKREVTSPGDYTLTVTDPVNGCISSANITVKQDIKLPEWINVFVSDTINCKTTVSKLNVSAKSEGMIYSWSGPEGFASSEPVALVINPGDYTVTLTDPVSGCSTKKTLTVIKDITRPEITLAEPDILTCKIKSVTLVGKSLMPKVSYNWSGPDNFSSSSDKPVVTKSGTYNVIATSYSTGCSTEKSLTVKENTTVPEKIAATVSGPISCATPKVKLSATSSTAGITYKWDGPEGFTSTGKNPEITLPGNYTLSATNPENGCMAKTNIMVTGEKCPEKQKQ